MLKRAAVDMIRIACGIEICEKIEQILLASDAINKIFICPKVLRNK